VKDSDVVISFAYKNNILVFLAKIGLSHQRVIFCERTHPRYDGRKLIGLIIGNYMYKRVHRLVVQNKSIQKIFDHKVIKNSIIIPNPIEKFKIQKYQVKSKNLIAVGRLVDEKNFGLLIEAFHYVIKELPDLKLHIYGEGPLRISLEQLVLKLGLSEHVFLQGVVDNIIEELSQSALFVQTSLYEGQSNALLEAIIHGLPVLVSNYNGIDDIITDEHNGYLFSFDSPFDLGQLIIKIMSNQDERIRVSNNNKHLAVLHDPKNVIKMWYDVIN
jgi:glycosyltransferase involved in cell wall biosynthesis